MGSGRGGLHKGTWGSHEGEALRARVGDVLRQFGGSVAGDAAAGLAEALVRVASGESPEDVVPEPGEVAFDLALDALSPFVPGGGRATRELAQAARRRPKGSKDAIEAARAAFVPRVPGEIWLEPNEYAMVMSELRKKHSRSRLNEGSINYVPIGEHIYTVIVEEFDEYYVIGKGAIE